MSSGHNEMDLSGDPQADLFGTGSFTFHVLEPAVACELKVRG